jgi:hypothetical protein
MCVHACLCYHDYAAHKWLLHAHMTQMQVLTRCIRVPQMSFRSLATTVALVLPHFLPSSTRVSLGSSASARSVQLSVCMHISHVRNGTPACLFLYTSIDGTLDEETFGIKFLTTDHSI